MKYIHDRNAEVIWPKRNYSKPWLCQSKKETYQDQGTHRTTNNQDHRPAWNNSMPVAPRILVHQILCKNADTTSNKQQHQSKISITKKLHSQLLTESFKHKVENSPETSTEAKNNINHSFENINLYCRGIHSMQLS